MYSSYSEEEDSEIERREQRIAQLDRIIREKEYLLEEYNQTIQVMKSKDATLQDILDIISNAPTSTKDLMVQLDILKNKLNQFVIYSREEEEQESDEGLLRLIINRNQEKIQKYQQAIKAIEHELGYRKSLTVANIKSVRRDIEREIENLEQNDPLNPVNRLKIKSLKDRLKKMEMLLEKKQRTKAPIRKRDPEREEEEESFKFSRTDCMICGEIATRWMEDDHSIRVCDNKLCELKL